MQGIITLLAVSIFIFVLVRFSGDPVDTMLPPEASKEDREYLRHYWGFDRPLPVQYFLFIIHAIQGDFGLSLSREIPAAPLVFKSLINTLQLVLASLIFAVVVGITIGTLSALREGGVADSFGRYFALLGQSAPPFWVGIMLILLLGGLWKILPTFGKGGIENLILPAFTLGWYSTAAMMRISRTATLDVMGSEYIKMARIKGLSELTIFLKHTFQNTLITVLTMSSIQLIRLLSSAVIVEVVFSWPGLGSLIIEAAFVRDYPVVQATSVTISALFITTNLLVDILYCYIDPRIRY